ncbi:HNH endonuclease signature motif containing protein [Microbacterium paraoxydans]|uniref:HNH endonuclease signature motif containing protein n=1 Tax=Microbacterium paraoxydans TaxID=199592 RepID=UPI001CFB27EB|nr:HNH endonuclease signature motif containing protein [Microbacterium paraoxydans]
MPEATDLDLDERRRIVDEWVVTRRRIAALEAEAAELLVEQIALHDADVTASPFHREAIYRSMIAEFSAAGHLSKGSVEFAFADARALLTHLPTVRASFASGAISVQHVREIARASAIIAEAIRNQTVDAAVMELFETAVLVVAEQDTAARTKAHAQQVAAALVSETVVERHRRAAEERCVTVKSLDDGLAVLTAVLPEWIATAIADRLSRMTRAVVRARADREIVPRPWWFDDDGHGIDPEDISLDDAAFDLFDSSVIHGAEGGTFTTDPAVEHLPVDTRTWAQTEADLFTDLLLTAEPSAANGDGLDGIHARVQITVAATTLAGADDNPAELDGHGPLHPDIARDLAGRNTGWTRLFLDPVGMVVETDTYTPTEGMRRYLRARDQHCRFPGCRMPVHRCEIDHNHDHAKGGKTRLDNLGHFCRGHHTLKHPDIPDPHRWNAQQEKDGSVTWHSPLGRDYADPPPRRVMFV